MSRLLDVTLLALRLGATAFGGPAAHVAMLRDEVVRRRQWMSDEEFLDLVGATNLIPGPNSTEMVMHVGLLRAGWRGLLLAGAAFISPAALIVGLLAAAYVRTGTTPSLQWLMYGIRPVVIAVVVHALISLGRTAMKDLHTALIGVAACAAALFFAQDVLVIVAGGLLTLLPLLARRGRAPLLALAVPVPLIDYVWPLLKIGALLYGSGYVLVAYLRDEFVVKRQLLTDTQLIDAVAIGQVTPGPVLTTATFVGYLMNGPAGAAIATVAIFLPAFLFVPLLHVLLARLRQSPAALAFLRGVNAASVGVMAAVCLDLGRSAIVDLPTVLLAVVAAVLLFLRVNSTWLVAGAAATGYLLHVMA